jgi:hypothetical protein
VRVAAATRRFGFQKGIEVERLIDLPTHIEKESGDESPHSK